MILMPEQRKMGMKYNMMRLLLLDIGDNRYTELQKLYEALGFRDNRRLVEKLKVKKNAALFFTKSVYVDIMYVIADFADESSELFVELYEKRFPKVFSTLERVKEVYTTGIDRGIKAFNFNLKEDILFKYMLYRTEAIEEPDCIVGNFDAESDSERLYKDFYETDEDYIDKFYCFWTSADEKKTEENIFKSSRFERYLDKRKEELAEYLGINKNDLQKKIEQVMKQPEDNINDFSGKMAELVAEKIVIENGGSTIWIGDIVRPRSQYVPNVDLLIKNYYKSYVGVRYNEEMKKKSPFTKMTLARECVPTSPEIAYRMILCMYEMDVLYKMFSIMMEQYYKDFSWEKITNQDFASRYEKLITDMKQITEKKEAQISTLSKKNEVLAMQITADSSKQTAPLVAENNKLIKQLEDKDEEISRLKRQLQYQEDFIAELNKPDEDLADKTYNLESLQAKRYLFVGHAAEALPELKRIFPNSLYMETETFSLSGVDVDAVVMLVKWMSHSMFYKIKSAGNLAETRNIMCNTKSIDTVLQKIYDSME